MRPLLANLLLSKSSDDMLDTPINTKSAPPLSIIHSPPVPESSEDSSPHPFPLLMQWLAPAQLGIAFLALGLQLIATTSHTHPVIHIAAPLLFLVAGVSSLVAHRSPGPFAASAVATTSLLSGLAAVIVLLGPALGVRLPAGNEPTVGSQSNFQEVTSTVYVFMCLAQGVISFVLATTAARFANNLDPKTPPVVVYVHPTTSSGTTSTSSDNVSSRANSPSSVIPQPPPLNNFLCRRQSNEYVSLPIVKKETPATENQNSAKPNSNLKFPSLEFSEC